MADMSWPYIAAFLDGEGSIHVGSHKAKAGVGSRPAIHCTMTQAGDVGKAVLEEMGAMLAAHNICTAMWQVRRPLPDHYKPCYNIRVSGWEPCVRFLKLVYPYLRVKRVLAQDVIRYHTMFPNMHGRVNVMLSWESRKRNAESRRMQAAS